MKYVINKISEREVEFKIGWNNLNKKTRNVLLEICDGRKPKIKDNQILTELDILGIINLVS
jgi:hypothetical protein